MFRPFLPCGIAYGFAYALPMALPMAFHALFPAEGIPPGCLYCTISARCLSTGFGRISAAFAFFRRRGVPPCRGGLLRRCRRGGRWRRPTGLNPSGTCSPCPGGEDHLKRRRRLRRIVPSPPVPPLLGCRHCSRESLSVGFTPYRRLPRRKENCMAGFISAASGSVQGCRGRSPRRNKL